MFHITASLRGLIFVDQGIIGIHSGIEKGLHSKKVALFAFWNEASVLPFQHVWTKADFNRACVNISANDKMLVFCPTCD